MPKIINKRKPNNWVRFDRSLMRDTRLKSHHKIIYLLFCSLSESCDNVYPSYSWIAEEVGYNYTGKHKKGSKEYESALQQFVSNNLEPLIKLGWIKKINNKGSSCDYEVFDHDCNEQNPQEKSWDTPKKNLRGNPQEKSWVSYKNIESKEKESTTPENFEKQEQLDSFKNNPLYEENRLTRFPYLTDKQIDLKIKSFIYDRPYTKFEVMMSVLAEENQRVLKAKKTNEWYKPKEEEPKEKHTTIGLTGRSFLNHETKKGCLDYFDFDYNEQDLKDFKQKWEAKGYDISID